MVRITMPGKGATASTAAGDGCRPVTDPQDIAYLRQRAADARILAFSAAEQRVAAVHESFARLYLARALQLEVVAVADKATEPGPTRRFQFHPDWTSTGSWSEKAGEPEKVARADDAMRAPKANISPAAAANRPGPEPLRRRHTQASAYPRNSGI